MITITRRLASQLRSVLCPAFGNFRGTGPAIGFIASKEGLTMRSVYGDAAVEYRVPGERLPETIWLPFEFLADVEGKKDDPVELEAAGKQVQVQWSAGNVPKSVKYDAKDPADKFPVLPATFTSNRPGLLQSLHEASEMTDPSAARFATHCVQLAADGTINATDGHQLLMQAGFAFPWKEGVLMPRTKVFASPELPQDQSAGIAQSGDWVVVSVGAWTCYLRTGVGAYSQVVEGRA